MINYLEKTFEIIIKVLKDIFDDWISKEMLVHKLKFSIYVVFLFVIFVLLWKKMVSNMQMDIIKALGIISVLPTSNLKENIDFIKDINRSNLIN